MVGKSSWLSGAIRACPGAVGRYRYAQTTGVFKLVERPDVPSDVPPPDEPSLIVCLDEPATH